MPWWVWGLVALGATTLLVGVVFRRQLRFALRVAKAVATDERLPRPLRWATGVALAVKVVPVPDFGIDEVILVVVGALLLTVYRSTFRDIVAELKAAESMKDPAAIPLTE